ncbi:MAG: hypothetical protein ABSD76_12255 [Terriglobales bacterium]|jgi:hypothetical protein
MDHGIVMINIPQQDSPALLVSTTHTMSDMLSAATLKNVGPMSLSACRLGWVVLFPSGNSEVHLGVAMNIPAGIETGTTWNAPAQEVSSEYAKQRATAIAFFVAEAYPSSGRPWKADLVQIGQQAENIASKLRSKSQELTAKSQELPS